MEKVIEEIVEYIKGYGDRMIIGISGHGASGKTNKNDCKAEITARVVSQRANETIGCQR
ncbi:hypothetical protein [Rossellomorea vietnamensis]|uniref:hypothetical protein n=1 Tax=Rossellomorea vietnamensis TaxID=218284 RepID=UPI001653BB6F|nr:hypothetical protein [Rossellomorea vietnamensis]